MNISVRWADKGRGHEEQFEAFNRGVFSVDVSALLGLAFLRVAGFLFNAIAK